MFKVLSKLKATMQELSRSLLLLSVIIVIPSLHASAQQTILPYPEKRITLQLQKATIILVATTLAAEEDVSVGLQLSSSGTNEPNIDIDVKDVPLSEVLNMAVQQSKLYAWEYRDGVINFYPTRDVDPFFTKLLETRIASFKPKSNNKFVIRDAVLDSAEVKKLMSTEKVTADRFGSPYRRSIYANNADLSAENMDVRSLLNKILRESEHNFYLLSWRQKDKREFALDF
jgi:hypothetical protein